MQFARRKYPSIRWQANNISLQKVLYDVQPGNVKSGIKKLKWEFTAKRIKMEFIYHR